MIVKIGIVCVSDNQLRRGNSSAGFVEVEGAQLVGAFESARTVVEVSGTDGAKLVVRLSDREELDVVALTEAFWKRGE